MTGARRVAVLSDVHGNAPALEAVRAELDPSVDLVVFGGDLTWGPLPQETLTLARAIATSHECLFVRGNAERALLELADDERDHLKPRERWMLDQHEDDDLSFLRTFAPSASVAVAGLGDVFFCHGSPLCDEDLITSETPPERLSRLTASIDERVVVSAHTHLQFDRTCGDLRSINPGSVGMPYEGRPGAFWAALGPDVELRRTDYDLDETFSRYRATTDPLAEEMVEALARPATREEVIAHAEQLERSG